MDENTSLDQLTLRLDDSGELNTLTITTLINSGVEEALSNMSPAQLIELEREVQKYKKHKASVTPTRRKSEGGSAARKRKVSNADSADLQQLQQQLHSEDGSNTPRPSGGGQYMNLPASTPHVEIRDGFEWLIFTYSTKGHVQEYCIQIDIDNLSLDDIPEEFKAENCVYPRALVPRESYLGNRYEYETSVNELAWKLTWLNPNILSQKRGLIQRAVDSYRNRTPTSRSRRVLRQEKLHSGTLRRRAPDSLSDTPIDQRTPKTLTFHFNNKGEPQKLKIRVDVENADVHEMDEDFRRNNCIYPQAMNDGDAYSGTRYEYETSCNELAWKLAWLNAQKLAGKKTLLQKAVDAYRSRFEGDRGKRSANGSIGSVDEHLELVDDDDLSNALLDKNEEFSEMVAQTLQQALAHDIGAGDVHSQISLEDHLAAVHDLNDDEHPQTVSTAELMGNLVS